MKKQPAQLVPVSEVNDRSSNDSSLCEPDVCMRMQQAGKRNR